MSWPARRWDRDLNIGDYKRLAISAAKDFGYGDDVVKKIIKTKDDREISDIMEAARRKADEE